MKSDYSSAGQAATEFYFLGPGRGGRLHWWSARPSRTVSPAMAMPMQRLTEAVKKKRLKGTAVICFWFINSQRQKSPTQAVASGVRALAWQDFLEAFQPSKGKHPMTL